MTCKQLTIFTEDIIDAVLVSSSLYFHTFSGLFIIDFKQLNISWKKPN